MHTEIIWIIEEGTSSLLRDPRANYVIIDPISITYVNNHERRKEHLTAMLSLKELPNTPPQLPKNSSLESNNVLPFYHGFTLAQMGILGDGRHGWIPTGDRPLGFTWRAADLIQMRTLTLLARTEP